MASVDSASGVVPVRGLTDSMGTHSSSRFFMRSIAAAKNALLSWGAWSLVYGHLEARRGVAYEVGTNIPKAFAAVKRTGAQSAGPIFGSFLAFTAVSEMLKSASPANMAGYGAPMATFTLGILPMYMARIRGVSLGFVPAGWCLAAGFAAADAFRVRPTMGRAGGFSKPTSF